MMSMEFNLPLSLVEENTRQYTYNLVLIMYFLGGIVGNTLCSAVYRIVKNEPYRVVLVTFLSSFSLIEKLTFSTFAP